MAACKNHPAVEATGYCANCGEAFCPSCLSVIQGRNLCSGCRTKAATAAPPIMRGSLPHPEANTALTYAIVGVFCCGIILEPLAIVKALNAKRAIQADPRLGGEGQATAALVIAIIGCGLWVIGVLVRVLGLLTRG